MIHQVFSSTLDTFKTLDFKPGCNLLVAEKTRAATDLQTRNSAGKSSFVEIVNFVLGSKHEKSSIFGTEALKEHRFGMTFDLAGTRTIVERCGESASQIVIREANTQSWSIRPTVSKTDGVAALKDADWRAVLGQIAFNLASDLPTYSPTFRMIFPYFARLRRNAKDPKKSDDGFLDPRTYSVKMQEWQQQIALSWLLGLEWRIPSDFEGVHLKEKGIKSLKKEFRSGIFESVIGSAAQLRSKLTLAEKRLAKLTQDVSEFRVLPEYRELEREASELAIQISQASNENALDQENADRLRQSLDSEKAPSNDDVSRMYAEAEVVLSEASIKRLEDVRRFHDAVVRNRQTHLEADIQRLESRIASRQSQAVAWEKRRQELMTTLSAHGALDQYTKIQAELTRLQTEFEELKRHHDIAARIESAKTDLTLERAQLHKRLQLNHDEQEARIQEAVVLFEQFSRSLCEHEGTLSVNATERGPEFDLQVEGWRGSGIKQMQIFCFDMMLMVLMARRNLGLGFLIHDSHLFDGMDPRQIGHALQIGTETCSQYGFQYIVTLNSDTLEHSDVRRVFDPEPYLLPVRLTDATETGGLFGFRFD